MLGQFKYGKVLLKVKGGVAKIVMPHIADQYRRAAEEAKQLATKATTLANACNFCAWPRNGTDWQITRRDWNPSRRHPVRHSKSADVRFGSKADISAMLIDVRFTAESGHGSARSGC